MVEEVWWHMEMTEWRQRQLTVIRDGVWQGLRGGVVFFLGAGGSENLYGGVNIWIEPRERRASGERRRGKGEVGAPGWPDNMSKSTGVRNLESQSWEFINDDLWVTLSKEGISASKAHTPRVDGENQSSIRDFTVLSPSWPFLMPRTNPWRTERGCPHFIGEEAESKGRDLPKPSKLASD